MPLRIYRGALDSGMLGECLNEIENNKKTKHIIIIPEHYSYEMERMMVDRFGVIGINNIQVLTPHRMAVNELDTDSTLYLTPAGKQMIVVRAVRECMENSAVSDELKRLMRQRSFADSMVTLISELKRHGVTGEMLTGAAAELEKESGSSSRNLANKLNAARLIFELYEELLDSSVYIDMDDDMFRLSEAIENGDIIGNDTHVWFMRFDEYLPHHMRLIRAVKSKAENVTVCLSYCGSGDESDVDEDDSEIYILMKKSYDALLAECDGEDRFFGHISSEGRAADIDFMVRHFGGLISYSYGENEEKNIELIECQDPHSEIEFIAEKIHTLIRESRTEYEKALSKKIEVEEKARKYNKTHKRLQYEYTEEEKSLLDTGEMLRYRDIGILFGGAMDYTHILDAVFTEHNIPYFADEKIILSEHPIAVQLLSVFDIYDTDWSYESVFRYLNAGFVFVGDEENNGFARLDPDDIARLDNYVSKYGIRGRSIWLKKNEDGDLADWDHTGEIFAETWDDERSEEKEAEEKNKEKINALRAVICSPLEELLSEKGEKTASEHAERLTEFLRAIHMYEGLSCDVRRFENDKKNPNSPMVAQQFSQIWNEILNVFDQICVTMRGIKMTFTEFGEYLKAGLSKCEIRTIPSALDSVYTGTVERSTSAPVKILFVAGAVNGTYPSASSYDGYFSDIDRKKISASIDLAATRDEQRTKQRYKVYKAVRAAEEKIYVTYPLQNGMGESYRRSGFVTDLTDMFGLEKKDAFYEDPLDERNITSEYAAKRSLLINCASPMNKLPPVWRSAYRCLRESGRYARELEQIGNAAMFYSHSPMITPETAQMLYNRQVDDETGRVYSATRLEAYSSCPMLYFLQFGLKLSEEENAGIKANEVGTYVHKLVQTLCERVEEEYGADAEDEKERPRIAWKRVSKENVQELVKTIVNETKERLPENIDDYNMRLRVMDRIEESVSRSAVNVMNSLKAGAFVLKDTELDIDRIRLEDGIYIKGFVDRVDEYVSDKYGRFLRIVDYKTGNTEFKKADIINGKNMQLMIYAIAAQLYYDREEDSDKAHSLSGIYYQHMRDRYMNGKTEDEAKSKLHDEMYFNGVTYLSEDEEKRTELVNAINETRESDSIYLPIRYVASGDVSPTSYDTETERDALIEKVKDNIVGIDKEIMCGMILPRPYSGGGALACEYCGYKDVCSFDNNKSIRFADKNGAGFGKEM